MTRRICVTLMVVAGLLWLSVPAFAQIGSVYDVDKDGVICCDVDADAVTNHINLYGTTDLFDDAIAEFGSFDESDIELLVELFGPVYVIHDVDLLISEEEMEFSDDDMARLWYHASWVRKDVSGNGTISAYDVLLIINNIP